MLKPQHICTLIDHNNDRSKEIQRTQRQAAVGEPAGHTNDTDMPTALLRHTDLIDTSPNLLQTALFSAYTV